jgi:lysophospholipase L1-like esterase
MMTAFGDSITAGKGASTQAKAYINLVADAEGWNLLNEARGGDALPDQLAEIYQTPVTGASWFLLDIGQNEAPWVDDATPAGAADWIASLEAAYVYLLTPNKVLANSNSCTPSGHWSEDDKSTAMGIKTFVAGDKVVCSTVGSSAWIIFDADLNSTATAKVDVDGTDFLTANPKTDWPSTFGISSAPFAVHVANLSHGPHRIGITATGANANSPLRVLFVAGNSSQTTPVGPFVIANTLYQANLSQDLYAKTNGYISRAANEVAADGFGIAVADVYGACTDSKQNPLCNGLDGIHPNDAGHAIIARAVMKAISDLASRCGREPARTAQQGSADEKR